MEDGGWRMDDGWMEDGGMMEQDKEDGWTRRDVLKYIVVNV